MQLAAPGKSYKIQIEIQANDEPTSHYQSALQAENRTLRDTCKQLNAMLKVLQRSNEYMMAQIDSKKLTSDKKMKQLEHENEEMKSKITNIERLLQGTDLSKCGSEETKPDSTDDDTTLQNVQCGKDNTDLCYDG